MKSYQARKNKSFANYRVQAIRFLRDYQTYEKIFVGEIADELRQLQKSKLAQLIREGRELKELTPEQITENADDYIDLITKSNELAEEVALCKESYLIDNDFEKLKELCRIYYEDFTELEFDSYEEVYKFAIETLDFFFKSSQSIISLGMNTKKDSATKSQTQTKD